MFKARILFIDAYDSFSNNIVSLLETELFVEVVQLKIDEVVPNFPSFLKQFAAVVAGPGPGHPANAKDVGLFQDLWTLDDDTILPVLGICLGLQSLVHAFGGTVQPMRNPRHGIETRVTSRGTSIFAGLESFFSVQYHSLQAMLGHHDQAKSFKSPHSDIWTATRECPDLEPVAWDFGGGADLSNPEDSGEPVLMAVKHVSKPYYGIQFHPESIRSDAKARDLIRNWWSEVQNWYSNGDFLSIPKDVSFCKDLPSPIQFSSILVEPRISASSSSHWSSPFSSPASSCSSPSTNLSFFSLEDDSERMETPCVRLVSQTMPLGSLDVPRICEALCLNKGACIVLDSERRQMPEVGRYSIIGVLSEDTVQHTYTVGSNIVCMKTGASTANKELSEYGGDIFAYLKSLVEERNAIDGDPDVPFWGGLMGYITYEACLETIRVVSPKPRDERPDMSFAFVERSIVIDHERQIIHVQSIGQDDQRWVSSALENLAKIQPLREPNIGCSSNTENRSRFHACTVKSPSEHSYKDKIRSCKSLINIGEAYELCLTDQTTVRYEAPKNPSPWSLYLQLRALNPAPFGAYLRLGPLTLISSSPERFLSWTRPTPHPGKPSSSTSTCQFRPIKGTVQKRQRASANGAIRTVSLAEATAQLSTTKERAENLMIVDLIRHDLHGVVGSGNVRVRKLMAVEEYETVYQLVSVIEGELHADSDHRPSPPPGGSRPPTKKKKKSGIDVLAASLPPGSMTGAPKKRACQLLQSVEGGAPRSVYSGVVGYMCVGGGGDFSVVIRSMFRWDSDDEVGEGGGGDEWRVGAGGAVTTLSTEEGEWEEMRAKMGSTMRVFGGE